MLSLEAGVSLVAEDANSRYWRRKATKVRDSVGDPGFEIFGIKTEVATYETELAWQIVSIVELLRHCEGLV
jgi:hypothetical protein